ncbi:unnamed protein product, partial [marine sediment metagenome]
PDLDVLREQILELESIVDSSAKPCRMMPPL